MNYTFDEAIGEMDALVNKLREVFPTEAYKLSCLWEVVSNQSSYTQEQIDEAYDDGYAAGRDAVLENEAEYEQGYEDGYEDAHSEYRSGGEE